MGREDENITDVIESKFIYRFKRTLFLNVIISSPTFFAGEIYMTTQSYQAKTADELSFDIGVHLEVIEKTLDGWWRVL